MRLTKPQVTEIVHAASLKEAIDHLLKIYTEEAIRAELDRRWQPTGDPQ